MEPNNMNIVVFSITKGSGSFNRGVTATHYTKPNLLMAIGKQPPDLLIISIQPYNDKNIIWDIISRTKAYYDIPITLTTWVGFVDTEQRIHDPGDEWSMFFTKVQNRWDDITVLAPFKCVPCSKTQTALVPTSRVSGESPEKFFEGMDGIEQIGRRPFQNTELYGQPN